MEQKIRVWAATDTDEGSRERTGTKSILGSDNPEGGRARALLVDLNVEKLGSEMAKTIHTIKALIPADDESNSGLSLKSVAIGLELSAEGGFTLVGTLKAGAKAAITITFERE